MDLKNVPDKIIAYCENRGIYEIYNVKGNILVYYSYFGKEGFYKITKNIKTDRETRRHLRYKKAPKYLLTKEGYTKYNYFSG